MTYMSLSHPLHGKCEWCGKDLGADPHIRGVSCMEAAAAASEAQIVGDQLRFVADILSRKACVFGEDPLDGALERLRRSSEQLDSLMHKRMVGRVGSEILAQHVETLDLSVRARRVLESMGVTSIGELINCTESQIRAERNCGEASINEIKARLADRGLRLRSQS